MKNKNRTHPTFTTKTVTHHPTNIHPKTDQNQANKKRTNVQKTPYFSAFLEGAKIDEFTTKTQTIRSQPL